MSIAASRSAIDAIDAQLIALLGQRAVLTRATIMAKRKAGLPDYDADREADIFARAPEGPVRDCMRAIVRALRESV